MRELIAGFIEDFPFYYYDKLFSEEMFATAGYSFPGWIILFLPLILLLVFYKVIDKTGGKRVHYFLTVLISLVLVFITNVGIIFGQLVNLGDADGLNTYVYTTSVYLMILSIIPILVWTIGLRFISTNNRYNPF